MVAHSKNILFSTTEQYLVCLWNLDVYEDGQGQNIGIWNVSLQKNVTSKLDSDNQEHRNQGYAVHKERSSTDSNEEEANIVRTRDVPDGKITGYRIEPDIMNYPKVGYRIPDSSFDLTLNTKKLYLSNVVSLRFSIKNI